MRLPILSLLPIMTVAVVIQGCASSGEQGPRGSGPVIEAEAIARVSATDAYQIVQNLRPAWLRTRGVISMQHPRAGEAVVYVDGVSYGDLGSLRQISAGDVARMEYLGAADATTRFGTGHAGGVIMVTTKH